jgi:dihydroorotase
LQYASTFGYTVWLRAQDGYLGNGVAAKGALATRMGLSGVPVIAETIALHTLFELVRDTRARVHICRSAARRASSWCAREGRRAADHLRRQHQPPAPHRHRHRLLQRRDAPDTAAAPGARPRRVAPALADGTIDALVSDHTPVDEDAKTLPFAEAEPGATGLELLLSLALKWGPGQAHAVFGARVAGPGEVHVGLGPRGLRSDLSVRH